MPHDPAQARRRWFGVFFLMMAAGMLIWGETLLKPMLRGTGFVIYWLACFGFTVLAMLTALLDLRAVRRRTRDQHEDLLQHVFDERKARRKEKREKRDRR